MLAPENMRCTCVFALGCLLLGVVSCKTGGAARPEGEVAAERRPAELPPPVERAREPRHLRTPAHLPDTARDLVWERMQGHGTDATLLLWAVLFLDYQGAGELARGILAEPRFSRPIAPDDATLNTLLPEEFFELQDELVTKAKVLLDVTSQQPKDGAALSRAYGELTAVCVRCHSVYLEETPRSVAGAPR